MSNLREDAMKALRRTSIVLLAATLTAAGALSAFAETARGSFERTLKVTGAVDLEVNTGSGSITVRTGGASSVYVKGTIRASSGLFGGLGDAQEKVRQLEANPPIQQTGNSIRIGGVEDRWLRQNVSISYELVVPADTRLRADTGSGGVDVEGLGGPVSADTGSGSIRISNIRGEVRADTGSGDIELDSIEGDVSVDTGSGLIRATGIAGGFVADTGSGSVRLEQIAPGRVQIDTGSGSVTAMGVRGSLTVDTGSGDITVQGEPAGEWRLEASSGSVTVRLPAQAGFDLDAHTGSGRIYTEHPITVRGALGRNTLQGKVRGGGFLLFVKTSSGNIYIE
ncbi:MAG: DUF4097 family beta strand repeat protein [Acidobacteria bacterium]|nr:DUF4097 family beta strand repeat protein [Acidobacteriota bacterium]